MKLNTYISVSGFERHCCWVFYFKYQIQIYWFHITQKVTTGYKGKGGVHEEKPPGEYKLRCCLRSVPGRLAQGIKTFPNQTCWGQQANLWAGGGNLIIKVQQKLRYALLVIPNPELWTDVWRQFFHKYKKKSETAGICRGITTTETSSCQMGYHFNIQ